MANSVNILLGVGLLSVPYALARGGWAGLGVLFLLGGVTNYTGKALVRCQDLGTLEVRDGEALPESFRSGDEDEEDWLRVNASESLSSASRPARRRQLSSYEDIGEAAFGRAGRTFITAVLYTELVGTCALFFILEGDHLALLFSGSGRDSAWFQAASACVMVPTLWLADLGALSYVGALGAAASVSLAGVVGYDLWMGTQGFTALPPGLADTSVLHASTLPVSFGLLAFVFAGHAVFPAIYASMETPEEYEPMLDATYAIVFATCLVIGGAGYALYGDSVRDEVTLNLPNGALSTLALALITINPLSKFALTMDPVARGLESVAGDQDRAGDGVAPDRGEGALLRGRHEPDRVVPDPDRVGGVPVGVLPEDVRGADERRGARRKRGGDSPGGVLRRRGERGCGGTNHGEGGGGVRRRREVRRGWDVRPGVVSSPRQWPRAA
jgi:vesicular inhibitory amino acid transporter